MPAAGWPVMVTLVAQTFLVECYWPGVTEPARSAAAARAAAAARDLRATGCEVRLLDTLLIPGDEVVFFRFAASSSSDVEHACALAELAFEHRVLGNVEVERRRAGNVTAPRRRVQHRTP